MIHYKIVRPFASIYYTIKVRGLFRYHDFDGISYRTASDALRALDRAINGEGCIIKIEK